MLCRCVLPFAFLGQNNVVGQQCIEICKPCLMQMAEFVKEVAHAFWHIHTFWIVIAKIKEGEHGKPQTWTCGWWKRSKVKEGFNGKRHANVWPWCIKACTCDMQCGHDSLGMHGICNGAELLEFPLPSLPMHGFWLVDLVWLPLIGTFVNRATSNKAACWQVHGTNAAPDVERAFAKHTEVHFTHLHIVTFRFDKRGTHQLIAL